MLGGVHAHVNLASLVKSLLQSGATEEPIGGKQGKTSYQISGLYSMSLRHQMAKETCWCEEGLNH